MSSIVEEHHSADGLLCLAVADDDFGRTIGFLVQREPHAAFRWHTHPELLEAKYGPLGRDELTRRFVDDVLGDRETIAEISRAGLLVDVIVTDDPDGLREWLQVGETVAFRYWSGRPCEC